MLLGFLLGHTLALATDASIRHARAHAHGTRHAGIGYSALK